MGINESTIDKVVRRVILEYGGVSDEVIRISREIYQLIVSQHRGHSWLDIGDGEHFKRFNLYLDGTEADGLISEVRVKLFAYDPSEMTFNDKYQQLVKRGLVKLSFSTTANAINLFIPYPVNDQMDQEGKTYLMSCINHEVKHCLQHNRRGGWTNVSDTYVKSLSSSPIEDNNTTMFLMKSLIRRMYYIFDPDEIDARLQEIYIELRETGTLSKCKAYDDVKTCIEGYAWINRAVRSTDAWDSKYFKEARSAFPEVLKEMLGEGMTPGQFFSYCTRGIRKFREQLRRIIGRYDSENPKERGSFGEYAKKEIPMRDMFTLKKENPSLWKKLMRILARRRK